MSTDARATADRIARNVHLVRSSPYIPVEPTELQWAFLCDDRPEILFAGGTGGGKSFAMLAAALMYAHVPGYAAVVFRKTFPDLMQPSGLIPLAASWLTNTDARKHDGGKKWTFPSGATLMFAHLENPQDRFKYAGLETQFLGWDEIAQMEEESYFFIKSRMRRSTTISPELADVPMRIRSTANPGHKHAKWVKNYFISDDDGVPIPYDPKKLHIPSTLDDNPHLDQEDYAARLEGLDPVSRAQMRHGDWQIMPQGNMFRAENFIQVQGRMTDPAYRIRAWDLAGSGKKSSDYCAGVLVARSKVTGVYRIEHVIHKQLEPGPLEREMRLTAELDGRDVAVLIEEEKSGSGKLVVSNIRRNILKGFKVYGERPTGDKVQRAGLFSALSDRSEVEITAGAWNEKFLSECVGFGPDCAYDDQVDAASYAVHWLSRQKVRRQDGSGVNGSGENSSALVAGYGSGENSGALAQKGAPPGEGGVSRKEVAFQLGGSGPRAVGRKRSPFSQAPSRSRIRGDQ